MSLQAHLVGERACLVRKGKYWWMCSNGDHPVLDSISASTASTVVPTTRSFTTVRTCENVRTTLTTK